MSSYSEPQPLPAPGQAPSPAYSQDPNPPQQSDSYMQGQMYNPHDAPYEPVSHSGSQRQQRADSPARKSLFEFVTPFDALASSSSSNSSQIRKKPVPNLIAPGPQADEQWSSIPDPKRKSVENLMDQLTRGQGPSSFPPVQSIQEHSPYQPYTYGDDPYQSEPKGYSRPLPQQPQANQLTSPRSSPPKAQPPPQQQQGPPQRQRRNNDSPVGQQSQRDKESSPGPRGNWKNQERGRTGKQTKSPQYVSKNAIFV